MNTKALITFVLVTLGILVGATALLMRMGGSNEGQVIADVAGQERHVKGAGSVTIVEFSDLQCPACRAIQEPLKKLLTKYEGKVKFVYRHFPLTTVHKNALVAAQATEAAHLQNKFWEMHDKLFETQTEWEEESDPGEKFANYAKELGLDVEKFKLDIKSQEARDAVNNDLVAATRYRLTGTPTFFVNGVETKFQSLESKIDEVIAKN